ncbi:MAG: hypothetical protein SFV54_10845 [Bryobacteraceae bacterium]|nr:hypothetical protein [Bryobacteraceae bacterium]
MVQVQQRVLAAAVAALLVGAPAAVAVRFYPDDPLEKMPPPVNVPAAKARKLSDYYDFFNNTFREMGERQSEGRSIRAENVNTVGEVADDVWYTNRHAKRRMSIEELKRGPGDGNAPSMEKPWKLVSAKAEGITPGFTMEDGEGRRYVIKGDPLSNPEMASAAEVISTKFFHALGYNVPENYVVHFTRAQLTIDPEAIFYDKRGQKRNIVNNDVDEILWAFPKDREGRYRALASLFIPGTLLGPFRYHGTRSDDPNDVIPHEHRRELRGLFAFAAWLNHSDSKALNSMDTLVEENGIQFIRHYLIDFGATLGSDSFAPKSPRSGNVYLFGWKQAAEQLFTLGLKVPAYARVNWHDIPSVGRFSADHFEPQEWRPNYPNPAFSNRLPDDLYWAAKKVMAFTDDEIRAIVTGGQYSDPAAAKYVADVLIERRNKVGRAFLDGVLPLEEFQVREGRLEFRDLAAHYGFRAARPHRVRWALLDNETNEVSAIPGGEGDVAPRAVTMLPEGRYVVAAIDAIAASEAGKTVSVYFRKQGGGYRVVGVDRTW